VSGAGVSDINGTYTLIDTNNSTYATYIYSTYTLSYLSFVGGWSLFDDDNSYYFANVGIFDYTDPFESLDTEFDPAPSIISGSCI
jgi:hypothetical protein